jgi:ketosteroid isomerase-like protein
MGARNTLHALARRRVIGSAGMAESHRDPLDVVTRFGEAWAAHDLDAALGLITEDCVFDNTDPAPDGERFVGREAIRRAWAPIFEDPSTRFEPEETIAIGDRVVQRWRYTWADGHVRGIDLMRVRDGLVAEKLSYVKG